MMSRSFMLVFGAATLRFFTVADHDPIAGYTPVSDVVEHSEIDLDMAAIETGADNLTEAGFAAAYIAYAEGGNSEKEESIRTIRGFSTSAQEKLTGETWFDVYADYWGSPAYADEFTSAACNGTGDFADVDMVVRSEGCLKGAQYQNVWMYVIHELEDAINDCRNGDLTANDGGPHAWDEGWAFYAGSLEGEEGTGDGQLLYALAQKRCENFATCSADDDGSDISGMSAVNSEIKELFNEGSGYLVVGDCDDAEEVKDKIIDLMTVPLLQGLLRYIYLADPDAGNGDEKEAAELWAFSAAVLPRIHDCDADVAVTIRANTEITSADAPVSEGYVVLKEKLESVYSCMGISCGQVGGLVISETSTEYFEGFEPCGDGDDGGISEGAGVAIGVVCAVAVVGLCAGLLIRRNRKRKNAKALDNDLGGFGSQKATGTL